jgi:AraC-like DNA-binding protein
MTNIIHTQTYWELLHESIAISPYTDPTDPLDTSWNYPALLGQGQVRFIELREGLEIEILDCTLDQRLIIDCPNFPAWLQFHFHLFGQHEDLHTTVGNKEYALYGSGLSPRQRIDAPEQRALEITLYLEPQILYSFIGHADGQLPVSLQHLVRSVEQEQYTRVGTVTPAMETALWQMLQCPYRGLLKRLFLESRALELVRLVLEQEMAIQASQGGMTTRGDRPSLPLKPGTLERIYYAQTLLHQTLHNPPSLPDLAKQVKLNEYTLKQGFRQVFGTSVFDYLHDYRLEQARQLLELGDRKVADVAETVGFASRSYFATAFKQKFGLNPKAYQQQKSSR